MDKQAIAEPIRQRRQTYNVLQRAPWDKIIHDRLIDIIGTKKNIALYAAFNGEVDTYGIIETLLLEGKNIFLPKVEKNELVFYPISGLDDLVMGTFGILEPKNTHQKIDKNELDVIGIPLSIFHKNGHRIGYGKGYYDRYLNGYEGLKVGLAYSFQESDLEFFEKNDIACNVIITEREIYEGETTN